MPGSLLPYIIARFYVEALHIFNVRRMLLQTTGKNLSGLMIEASDLGLETFRMGKTLGR